MFEVRIPPDTVVEPHAHRSDEIIYVLSGELRLGARVVAPGDSVYIGGMTLYGFRTGHEGVRFLDFRATKDASVIWKDEYLASRAAS
jgi:hypothetical protein